jgi:hypothetical protein
MDKHSISLDEKRRALERVLGSDTFSRSEQLRKFLRFICEADFHGRSNEINEYNLGVSVLGRKSDFNPAEDSCVRSRAHELRSKLKAFYEQEDPSNPIQIEIHKGGYIPRFERKNGTAKEQRPSPLDATASVPAQTTPSDPAVGRRSFVLIGIAGVLLGFVLASALLYLRFQSLSDRNQTQRSDPPALSPEMSALWKPFLDGKTPLLICFQARLSFYSPSTGLVVRDFRTNQLTDIQKSKPLQMFQKRMGETEMRETYDYADAGAVESVFLLSPFFARQHKDVNLKRSESLGWEDIRNNDIVILGKPALNPSIQFLLNASDFVDDEDGNIIRNLHPLPGELPSYSNASTHGEGTKYALITVFPGPQPGHSIMVLDGTGSELYWALADAVTDPQYAKEIVQHLRLPSGECPQAYQVVVRADFKSYVPIKIQYVTHHVLKG